MKRFLGIAAALLFAMAGARAQTAAPTTITLEWANPTAATTSIVIFRGTCAGTVTGTTQPSGAIVGQCTPTLAQSALASYYTMNTPTAPTTLCMPTAPANGCWIDNAVSACLSTGCVYDIEAVDAAGTSTPSGMIAVSWNAPPAPPPAPTGLTIIAHAKTISGAKETLSASWTDKAGMATGYFLWGAGKLLQSGTPAPTSTASYSLSWTGPSVSSAFLDLCDAAVGCLPPVSF